MYFRTVVRTSSEGIDNSSIYVLSVILLVHVFSLVFAFKLYVYCLVRYGILLTFIFILLRAFRTRSKHENIRLEEVPNENAMIRFICIYFLSRDLDFPQW